MFTLSFLPVLIGLAYLMLMRKKYPPLMRPQYHDFHFLTTFKMPTIRGAEIVDVPVSPLPVKTHITMMPSTFESIVEGIERAHRDDANFAWTPPLDEQLRQAVLAGHDQYGQFTERAAGEIA